MASEENKLEKLVKITPLMKTAMAEEDMAQFGLLAYKIIGACEKEGFYREGVNVTGYLYYHAVDHFMTKRQLSRSQSEDTVEAIFGFRGIAAHLHGLAEKQEEK